MDPNTRALMMGAAAAGGSAQKIYVEDVFSTWLYTGNGSTQTITNGIDLSGKGGLVWCKARSAGNQWHALYDTSRGATKMLFSNATNAETTDANTLTSFNNNGFSLGSDLNYAFTNPSGQPIASWTFRKQAKFFDVVTWTGNGTDGRQIPHNLGSTPGCVIIKRTDSALGWAIYHRSRTTTYGELNSTNAFATSQLGGYNMQEVFGNSSTVILPDANNITVARFEASNASGGTYVAYLFAHDAGGFGDSGNDNVISCGSFVHTNGTVPSISLGYEPQWVLIKNATGAGSWLLFDNMRGMPVGSSDPEMYANSSAAESNTTDWISPNATGFTLPYFSGLASNTFIYIAIRRGPMKTPTDATKVFAVDSTTAINTNIATNFPVDWGIVRSKTSITDGYNGSRLTGSGAYLLLNSTGAESAYAGGWAFDSNSVFKQNQIGTTPVTWMLRRAPGFFDVVAYTGTGVNRTVSHNLGVAPELMIVKIRSDTYQWIVNSQSIAADSILVLNGTSAELTSNPTAFNGTRPTASVFSVGTAITSNNSGQTYIAYLFASCPGVSKVGGYTGTGTTLNVDCGFTNGARFVLIKRTDSTGDWYVWDTARGIVSGNDPYLLLNSTAAEVTNTDYIDPLNAGFQISSTAPAAINANGGTYIYLAIA